MVVDVEGEVDEVTAPDLRNCLTEQLELARRPVALEVVLTRTTFLDARGIRALVGAARAASQRSIVFRVTGCSQRTLRIFDIVGVKEELQAS